MVVNLTRFGNKLFMFQLHIGPSELHFWEGSTTNFPISHVNQIKMTIYSMNSSLLTASMAGIDQADPSVASLKVGGIVEHNCH